MQILLQSLFDIFPIIILILLGYILNEKQKISLQFSQDVSYIIMNIALPASILASVLEKLNISTLLSLWKPLLIASVAYIVSYVIAFILVKCLSIPNGRKGLFINALVNANTIFIGLPLNISLLGADSMNFMLTYYVVNTVSTWVVGAALIINDGTESKSKYSFNIKSILTPPVISLIIAVILLLFDIRPTGFVKSTLTYIGNLLTPLALLFIGITLSKAGIKSVKVDKDTVAALIGKFIVAPLIMVGVLWISTRLFGKLDEVLTKTFIIQSSVSALTILPILANEGKGDVKFATNIVVTTTLLFAIVIPIIMEIIG